VSFTLSLPTVIIVLLGRFAPYFERLCFLSDHTDGIEGASDDVIAHTRQVLHTATTHEHDGMLLKVVADTRVYVVTSIPFVNRTRATLRSAEFGFFGVEV